MAPAASAPIRELALFFLLGAGLLFFVAESPSVVISLTTLVPGSTGKSGRYSTPSPFLLGTPTEFSPQTPTPHSFPSGLLALEFALRRALRRSEDEEEVLSPLPCPFDGVALPLLESLDIGSEGKVAFLGVETLPSPALAVSSSSLSEAAPSDA